MLSSPPPHLLDQKVADPDHEHEEDDGNYFSHRMIALTTWPAKRDSDIVLVALLLVLLFDCDYYFSHRADLSVA